MYRAKDLKAKTSYERWFDDVRKSALGLAPFTALCEQHNIADDEKAAALLFEKHADGESTMTRDAFVKLCEATLGETRDVVIKFMSDHRTFRRELDSRSGKSFSPRFVINILESYEGADLHEATTASPEYARFANYAGAIVMEAADRNLEQIYQAERLNFGQACALLRQLVEALEHVHDRGIIHGDVKPKNAVRLNDRIKLIDLDAALTVGGFFGEKFSSGRLRDKSKQIGRKRDAWQVFVP